MNRPATELPLCGHDRLLAATALVIDRGRDSFILTASGADVHAFRNACPHQGTPLENPLGQVLDADGAHLVCSTHGGRFRLTDGYCVTGICQGLSLRAGATRVDGGQIYLALPGGA
jgi:nitrite reductase/ring-hydroxylating ferredoxin subunit